MTVRSGPAATLRNHRSFRVCPMARRKNAPDLVMIKCSVAERLRELRVELFGDRGGPELARRLGLPVRTWYNYEAGVTVPAEGVLRLIEQTHVEATGLLPGGGP